MHARSRGRSPVALSMLVISAVVMVAPTVEAGVTPENPPIVVAQAGSVGGTIGKRGKSVSGEGEDEPRRRALVRTKRRPEAVRSAESAGNSISGRWGWLANCVVTEFRGKFDLTQSSPTHFSGSFGKTSSIDSGPFVNGQIKGDQISFKRQNFDASGRTQVWTGRISPPTGRAETMKGSATARFGTCRFEAKRD